MQKTFIDIPYKIKKLRPGDSNKLNWLLETARQIRLNKENNYISEDEAKAQLNFIIDKNSLTFLDKIKYLILNLIQKKKATP